MCSIRIGRVRGFVQFFISEGDSNPEIEQEEMDIFDYSLRRVVDLVAALAFQAGLSWLNRYFRTSAAAGASRAAAEVGVPTVHGTGSRTGSGTSGSAAGDGGSHGDPSDGQPGGCGGDKPGVGDVVLDIEAE